MARKRRQFLELETVETLLLQGAVIICQRCGKPITLEDVRAQNVQKEHKHEFELKGPDTPDNCCFSHAARPCHAQVTHGTKATFAGSSRHRIAKANDSKRKDKFKVEKRAPRQRPLTPDRVSIPSQRCRGCGECHEACTCKRREKRQSFVTKRRSP